MYPFTWRKCDPRTLAFAVTFSPSRSSSIDDGAQGTRGRFLPGPLCVRVFFRDLFHSLFFVLGLMFVRYGERVEGVIVLRKKDACPKIHIIICTIFIFLSLFLAVLSTLLALVFSPSRLRFASPCPTTLRPFYPFPPF